MEFITMPGVPPVRVVMGVRLHSVFILTYT